MKNRETQKIYISVIFTIFFFLLLRNLTNAALWVDEGVEYWYSKSIHAIIPGESVISTMYERIVRTYQPPLYNVLMYIWLRINDTEVWFRLFGVLMGFGTGIALYKTIKKLANIYVALLSLIFLANIYQFVYYVQECAEYNLMFLNVSWMLYYFVESIKESSVKNVALFTLFCVLAVYSQYGAVFVVFGFATTLLIWNIVKKRKYAVRSISVSYICAGIFGAVPLYFFFLKEQLANQIMNDGTTIVLHYDGNLVTDIVNGLKTVLEFNFIPNNIVMKWVIYLLLIFVMFMTIVLLINKDELTISLFFACGAMVFLYCVLIKIGIYGYGSWGNRYCLFMLPVVFFYCAAIMGRFWVLFQSINIKYIKEDYIKVIFGVVLGAVCIYSIQGYEIIGNGWIKEDNKAMFRYWYAQTPNDCETLVYYGAVPVFSFYLEHEENYVSADILDKNQRNLTLQPSMRNRTKEEYVAYLKEIYTDMPTNICFVCSHYIVDDWKTMLEAFGDLGYEYQIVWESKQAQVIMLNG